MSERTSVILSEACWSQSREVVQSRTPADEVMEAEDEMIKRRKLSLGEALTENEDGRLSAADEESRVQHWHVFLAYVFQDGIANPWQAFKNLLAAVRRVNPEYLGAISQTDLGVLLGETRAAPSAREIRIVEDQMKRWGVRGFRALGGTKSDSARAIYSEVQKGNTNRRGGKKKARSTTVDRRKGQ